MFGTVEECRTILEWRSLAACDVSSEGHEGQGLREGGCLCLMMIWVARKPIW